VEINESSKGLRKYLVTEVLHTKLLIFPRGKILHTAILHGVAERR
jgi:hypothetical protein